MRCMAEAAAMAWSRWPPTSSHAAMQRTGAAVRGAAKIRWCMGS